MANAIMLPQPKRCRVDMSDITIVGQGWIAHQTDRNYAIINAHIDDQDIKTQAILRNRGTTTFFQVSCKPDDVEWLCTT